MNARKLRLVGWYHSHPDFEARPTYQDVVLQKKYQATVSNLAEDEACIAFVICKSSFVLRYFLYICSFVFYFYFCLATYSMQT